MCLFCNWGQFLFLKLRVSQADVELGQKGAQEQVYKILGGQ